MDCIQRHAPLLLALSGLMLKKIALLELGVKEFRKTEANTVK